MYNFTPAQLAWLAALESGKYEQGHGRLTTYVSQDKQYHCCLGVACVLYQENVGTLSPKIHEDTHTYHGTKECIMYDKDKFYVPAEVQNALGLRDNQGTFAKLVTRSNDKFPCSSLASMNDEGMTFAEIAAYIRANPENVFKS